MKSPVPKSIGGAPTRASTLPEKAADRKKYPLASGVFDYFPDALAAIARVSFEGNEQHHPGKPLHWDRSKSQDEADTMLRHFSQRGTLDTDGMRHSAKMAWRALALLQKEIEAEAGVEAAWPRYYRSYAGVIYRASSSTDLGEFWQDERWIPSCSEPPVARWANAYQISIEQAAKAGAEVHP